MRIILNPDKAQVEKIKKELINMKELFGKQYCPCCITKTDDDVCMCKSFRDSQVEGLCYCGLYQKVKDKREE